MKSGFSLLELSLVLVIIGLLASGIVVGADLIRSAEIRSVSQDLNTFATSARTFRLKYSALPGDMRNATQYWGAVNTDPAVCRVTIGTGQATCNGNGDGRIHPISDGSSYHEMFRSWQQMVNAGLIKGNFTGVAGPDGSFDSVIGTNVPASRVEGAGYSMLHANNYGGDADFFALGYHHIIVVGSRVSNDIVLGPIFTPMEALSIDQKIDDGRAGTGVLVGPPSTSPLLPGCTTTNMALTSLYNTSATGRRCALVFNAGF